MLHCWRSLVEQDDMERKFKSIETATEKLFKDSKTFRDAVLCEFPASLRAASYSPTHPLDQFCQYSCAEADPVTYLCMQLF